MCPTAVGTFSAWNVWDRLSQQPGDVWHGDEDEAVGRCISSRTS